MGRGGGEGDGEVEGRGRESCCEGGGGGVSSREGGPCSKRTSTSNFSVVLSPNQFKGGGGVMEGAEMDPD